MEGMSRQYLLSSVPFIALIWKPRRGTYPRVVDPSVVYVSTIPESPWSLELVILGVLMRRKLGNSTAKPCCVSLR
jgi:hypothetical protein